MTPRRQARVLALLACLVVLLSTAVGAVGASAARAQATGTAPRAALSTTSSTLPARLTVTELSPKAPSRDSEEFAVGGTITNTSSAVLSQLTFSLQRGSALTSREALHGWERKPGTFFDIPDSAHGFGQTLAPGQSATFRYVSQVGALGLTELGVYPLRLVVDGLTNEQGDPALVAQVETFLPWTGGVPVAHTRVVWLTSLTAEPSLLPDGRLSDERTGQLVAPGGRLYTTLAGLVAASHACGPDGALLTRTTPGTPARAPDALCTGAAPGPVTPVATLVDPLLVATLERMSAGYETELGGRAQRGTHAEDAREWLRGLRAVALHSSVIGAPYGDVDPNLVADTPAAQPASNADPLRSDVSGADALGARPLGPDGAGAMRLGLRTLADAGVASLLGVAWPSAAQLSSGGAAVVREELAAQALGGALHGAQPTVIVPESAVLTPDSPRTLGALSLVPGLGRALVLDSGLSQTLTALASGPRLSEQQFIAESAALAFERTSEERTVAVAVGQGQGVTPESLGALLGDTQTLPWLCAARLPEALHGAPSCAGHEGPQAKSAAKTPVVEARTGLALRLTGPLLTSVQRRLLALTRGQDWQLTHAVLPEGAGTQALHATFDQSAYEAESAQWAAATRATRLLTAWQTLTSTQRGQVGLGVGASVVISGHSGTISVVVFNQGDAPVELGVSATSGRAGDVTQGIVPARVPAHTAVQVSLHLTAHTSGTFLVFLQLRDRRGAVYGAPATLLVRSTQLGVLALLFTAGGVLALLLGVGLRVRRRRQREARDGGDASALSVQALSATPGTPATSAVVGAEPQEELQGWESEGGAGAKLREGG